MEENDLSPVVDAPPSHGREQDREVRRMQADASAPVQRARGTADASGSSSTGGGRARASSDAEGELASTRDPVHGVPSWRPLVTVNAALSLDGKIAAAGGARYRFSDDVDHARVHKMRAEHEAILVGIGTVLADDPSLRVRQELVPGAKDPIRVVLDSRHRTPVTARVAEGSTRTLIYSVDDEVASPQTSRAMGAIEVVDCPPDKEGRVDLRACLTDLADRGIDSLMVEGGSRVLTSFLTLGFVDRISLYMAPVIMGEHAPPLVFAQAPPGAGPLARFHVVAGGRFGEGVLMHLAPNEAPK